MTEKKKYENKITAKEREKRRGKASKKHLHHLFFGIMMMAVAVAGLLSFSFGHAQRLYLETKGEKSAIVMRAQRGMMLFFKVRGALLRKAKGGVTINLCT